MQEGTYYVFRSTTEKLGEHMTHIEESGDTIVTSVFTGGRDWSVVCRKGITPDPFAAALKEFAQILRKDQESRDQRLEAAVTRGVRAGSRARSNGGVVR
jgi:hypothetical protein